MGALVGALPALEGFFTIGVLIALGWVLAWRRVLTTEHRKMMTALALYVASPALMYTTVVGANLGHVFARSVVAAYGAIVVAGATYLVFSRLRARHGVAGTTIGTLLACYTNAGNLGIPVAAYALRDVTWIVPILLVQVAFLQPLALAILDFQAARAGGGKVSVARLVTLPVRNPMTIGVLLGLIANLVHARLDWFVLPGWVSHPIEMLGAVAVPLMLLAFGVSLRLDPKPAGGSERTESWVLVGVKILVQPLAAYVLAAWVLRLDPVAVHAVTVIACLPPAQNIFAFASRYDVRLVFARDTIFRATLASVVVILAAATVLA